MCVLRIACRIALHFFYRHYGAMGTTTGGIIRESDQAILQSRLIFLFCVTGHLAQLAQHSVRHEGLNLSYFTQADGNHSLRGVFFLF